MEHCLAEIRFKTSKKKAKRKQLSGNLLPCSCITEYAPCKFRWRIASSKLVSADVEQAFLSHRFQLQHSVFPLKKKWKKEHRDNIRRQMPEAEEEDDAFVVGWLSSIRRYSINGTFFGSMKIKRQHMDNNAGGACSPLSRKAR